MAAWIGRRPAGLPQAFAVTCAKQEPANPTAAEETPITRQPRLRVRAEELVNVSKLPFWVAAILCCSAAPARSQELPAGKGKEMVAAQCTTCHAFRAAGGYTPTGWTTVGRMLTNHGAPIR